MHIQTKNLLLRDFSMQDLPLYTALRSHPDFQLYYDDDDVTPEKSAFLLQLFIKQSQGSPRQKFQLAICDKDGVVMGSCGIRLEAAGQASIGFELGGPGRKKAGPGKRHRPCWSLLFVICEWTGYMLRLWLRIRAQADYVSRLG